MRPSARTGATTNISTPMAMSKGSTRSIAACVAKGATILKPLSETPWGTKDFYLQDPEGYILAFGETIKAS